MRVTSKPRRVFEFLKYTALAVMPILDIYRGIYFSGMSILNLGLTVLLVFAVVEILIDKGKFEFNRELLIVMGLLLALNIIDGFLHIGELDIMLTFKNTMYTAVMAIIAVYYIRTTIVDKERFFKFLCAVGVLCSVFICIQYVFYLYGVVVYGFIPGLTLDTAIKDVWDVSIYYGRPTSFFREPAHYAIYIMPLYTFCLFRKKYLLSAIYLAGLIVSTSSTGLFGALVVTGIYIYKEKKIPIIFKWILAIIGAVLVIQFIPALNESSVLDKLKFVNLTENIRVLGTLPYFKYYGLKEIVFGVGLNQLQSYMKIFTSQDVQNYANSLFFSFFSFGLLGGSLWTWYVVRLHKLSLFKGVYIIFIVVCLSDQILFNRNLFYLLMLLHVFADKAEDAPADATQL
jgi:hypothetical protein